MELRLDGKDVQVTLAPDARPSASPVSDFTLTSTRVSFSAVLGDRLYRFEGRRRNDRWLGTLVATNGGERGTWGLSELPVEAKGTETLPAPTGRHATGRVAFAWVDQARLELETRSPEDKRELLVYVFYPAERSASAPPARYMPEAQVMLPYWKDALTQPLQTWQVQSRENVPAVKGRERFPVAIFAPGGGQKVLAYTSLLEDLASHGFVVAAIEPPYNAPAMQFPDGRTIGRLTPSERGWEEPKTRDDQPRIYEQMVLHWVRDMSFVLDQLALVNRAKEGLFAGRIDLTRVGAFGHSRGGQAAGTVRLIDSRFRGAVNLDGNIRGRGFQPIKGSDGGQQPFMWIEKQTPTLNDQELEKMGLPKPLYQQFLAEVPRLMQSVTGGSAHVTIARFGIEHLDFSDNPFWSASTSLDVRAGKRRTIELARAYVLAFFDGCLRGRWAALLQLLSGERTPFPEATSRRFGKLAN